MNRDRFDEAQKLAWERILKEVRRLRDEEGMTLSEAAKRTASSTTFSKSEIYRAVQDRRKQD